MRAAVFQDTKTIAIENVADPQLEAATDAIVRITHAGICGTDLWFYRGLTDYEPGSRCGHELMGVVEEVGAEVGTLKKGDRVFAPFAYSDGVCDYCREGVPTSCRHGGFWALHTDGGQGEAVRAPFADATLVKIPQEVDNDRALLKAILPLTDVMGTGYHAAIMAGVQAGSTVVVVGDGAVGLCGVLAARLLGAERIIAVGRHAGRLDQAKSFGATDSVSGGEEEVIGAVDSLTSGGAAHVLECVGSEASMRTAFAMTRPGGTVGYVGTPHGAYEALDVGAVFMQNKHLRGGIAPVRVYQDDLLQKVVDGELDPSPVLDMTVDLDGVPAGYAAMDERRATKVMVSVSGD